jgi:hypothetical protein
MLELITGNPELVVTLFTGLMTMAGILVTAFGMKYKKFKKYADVMVTAIEVAKSSKQVKKEVKEAVAGDFKVDTVAFVEFVQEVVEAHKVKTA